MDQYKKSTRMLDFHVNEIQVLIQEREWDKLEENQKILESYNFVRDEIKFGYNIDDNIPASKVLSDGYGQCNTKGTLFMAILRALGIACRLHGFTIRKEVQKGAVTGIYYYLAPEQVVHSWVEVFYENQWYNLEGFILDYGYLSNLQQKFNTCKDSFCGYGVAVTKFQTPNIDWKVNHTYIQKEGIVKDFGRYDSPDDFFLKHSQQLGIVKRFFYRHLVRHHMNRNVARIRKLS
jgi:hypothetical protein